MKNCKSTIKVFACKGLGIFFLCIYFNFFSIAQSEFSYDKIALQNDFLVADEQEIEKLYPTQIPKLINDSSAFTIYDLELESFCAGFCCGPIGMIKYVDKKSTVVQRKSFWVGCGSFAGTTLLFLLLVSTSQSMVIID